MTKKVSKYLALLLVLAVIALGSAYLFKGLNSNDAPPSLEFDETTAFKGFIGDGTYLQYEAEDIMKVDVDDFQSKVSDGVQIVYANEDLSVREIFENILPDTELKIMLAYYDVDNFDVYPKGPYKDTVTISDIDSYVIPAQHAFFLVASKSFYVTGKLNHAVTSTEVSELGHISELPESWNLLYIANPNDFMDGCYNRIKTAWIYDDYYADFVKKDLTTDFISGTYWLNLKEYSSDSGEYVCEISQTPDNDTDQFDPSDLDGSFEYDAECSDQDLKDSNSAICMSNFWIPCNDEFNNVAIFSGDYLCKDNVWVLTNSPADEETQNEELLLVQRDAKSILDKAQSQVDQISRYLAAARRNFVGDDNVIMKASGLDTKTTTDTSTSSSSSKLDLGNTKLDKNVIVSDVVEDLMFNSGKLLENLVATLEENLSAAEKHLALMQRNYEVISSSTEINDPFIDAYVSEVDLGSKITDLHKKSTVAVNSYKTVLEEHQDDEDNSAVVEEIEEVVTPEDESCGLAGDLVGQDLCDGTTNLLTCDENNQGDLAIGGEYYCSSFSVSGRGDFYVWEECNSAGKIAYDEGLYCDGTKWAECSDGQLSASGDLVCENGDWVDKVEPVEPQVTVDECENGEFLQESGVNTSMCIDQKWVDCLENTGMQSGDYYCRDGVWIESCDTTGVMRLNNSEICYQREWIDCSDRNVGQSLKISDAITAECVKTEGSYMFGASITLLNWQMDCDNDGELLENGSLVCSNGSFHRCGKDNDLEIINDTYICKYSEDDKAGTWKEEKCENGMLYNDESLICENEELVSCDLSTEGNMLSSNSYICAEVENKYYDRIDLKWIETESIYDYELNTIASDVLYIPTHALDISLINKNQNEIFLDKLLYCKASNNGQLVNYLDDSYLCSNGEWNSCETEGDEIDNFKCTKTFFDKNVWVPVKNDCSNVKDVCIDADTGDVEFLADKGDSCANGTISADEHYICIDKEWVAHDDKTNVQWAALGYLHHPFGNFAGVDQSMSQIAEGEYFSSYSKGATWYPCTDFNQGEQIRYENPKPDDIYICTKDSQGKNIWLGANKKKIGGITYDKKYLFPIYELEWNEDNYWYDGYMSTLLEYYRDYIRLDYKEEWIKCSHDNDVSDYLDCREENPETGVFECTTPDYSWLPYTYTTNDDNEAVIDERQCKCENDVCEWY